jgi:hypothetical protein
VGGCEEWGRPNYSISLMDLLILHSSSKPLTHDDRSLLHPFQIIRQLTRHRYKQPINLCYVGLLRSNHEEAIYTPKEGVCTAFPRRSTCCQRHRIAYVEYASLNIRLLSSSKKPVSREARYTVRQLPLTHSWQHRVFQTQVTVPQTSRIQPFLLAYPQI